MLQTPNANCLLYIPISVIYGKLKPKMSTSSSLNPNSRSALPTGCHSLVDGIPTGSEVSFQVFSSSFNPPPFLCSYLITNTALVEVLLTSDSVYQYCTHTVVRISLMQKFREALCLRPFLTPHNPATEKCNTHSLGQSTPKSGAGLPS